MNEAVRAPVIAGIDGSQAGIQAVRWAAREAADLNRPLRLLHVTPWEVDDGVVWVDAARYWVKEAKEIALVEAPTLSVEEEFTHGNPVAVLLERSESAHELVLGSHGLGGIVGQLIGTTPPPVVAHASCPVVLVRGEENHRGPVVVGVDGSPLSERAIGFAFDAASRAGVPVRAVHTWSDAELTSVMAMVPIAVDWNNVKAEEHELLAERLAGWQERYPDVTIERKVTKDRPARSLLEAARGARILVVGSRGRGGFKSLLLGSTSRALMDHAPCPLAIVRSGGES